MLIKLLKYEFKATGRIFLPLYLALIVISFIQRLFLQFNIGSMGDVVVNILSLIVPSMFGAIIIAICVVTFVMIIQRFYKNLLGREGYLMFTLPVSVSKLIWSKLIVVMVWTALSVLVGIISFMIVVFNINDIGLVFSEFSRAFSLMFSEGFGLTALICFLIVVVSCVSEVLSIYLSMAIGQLSGKHKGLCSVGAYIGLSIIVNNIVMAIIFGAGNSALGKSILVNVFQPMSEMQAINSVMIILLAFFVIQSAVYFLLTKYLLTKKLNLE